MIFNRDKSLIISSVLFLAITGSFLLGCSEGSDSSPVSALITDTSIENFKSGGRTIDGTFITLSGYDKTYGKELGGIPVTISKYVNAQNAYVEFDKTVTSLENNTGKFKFSGLHAGSYKISTPKTNTFQAFEGMKIIEQEANASESKTLEPIQISFQIPHITDEMNGLKVKVVCANNGKLIDNATVKIDDKAVSVTNENGIVEVNGIGIGFHNIEVEHLGYEKLVGKFRIVGNGTYKPDVVGSGSLELCLVEPGHECSIVGRFFTNNKIENPTYIKLFKYEPDVTDENNITYYKLDHTPKLTKTSYGIDGTPDGSFKFLNLDEGFYRVYVSYNNDSPSFLTSYATSTCIIYNLSNYDKTNEDKPDISNYRWEPFKNASGVLSRPIAVTKKATVYWSNIEDNNDTAK